MRLMPLIERSSVETLFAGRCPSAIGRVIALSVVDAINGFVFRSLAHIRKKMLKLFPSATDFDSDGTIARIRRIGVVVTSSDHPSPRGVCRAVSISSCVAMRRNRCASRFFTEIAQAARRATAFCFEKISGGLDGCFPAIAACFPKISSAALADALQCSKSSEFLSCQLKWLSWHGI